MLKNYLKKIKWLVGTKFFKFGLVGVLTSVFVWGGTVYSAEFGQQWYYPTYVVLSIIAFISGFLLSQFWIYKKRGDWIEYGLWHLFFLLANVGLVYLVSDIFGLHYLLSIFLITTALFILKYFTYDKKVFVGDLNEKC